MSSASKIQSFFTREKPTRNIKEEVLKKTIGKSKRETERIIEAHSVQSKRELKITLNERLLKKLEKIQKDFGDCSELNALEALMDEKLRELDARASHRPKACRESSRQRYIARKVKEDVFKQAKNRCQFVAKSTGSRCQIRTNLHIDHIKPIAIGGKSSRDNLRVLCFTCNQRSYQKIRTRPSKIIADLDF